jgi:hypothetical protein
MKTAAVTGIIIMFAGYAVASYGVVLLRGWNIPWRGWVDPLHAWTWPADGSAPPPIPPTQVWPDSARTATLAAGTATSA